MRKRMDLVIDGERQDSNLNFRSSSFAEWFLCTEHFSHSLNQSSQQGFARSETPDSKGIENLPVSSNKEWERVQMPSLLALL
jgi:hypothetical protein